MKIASFFVCVMTCDIREIVLSFNQFGLALYCRKEGQFCAGKKSLFVYRSLENKMKSSIFWGKNGCIWVHFECHHMSSLKYLRICVRFGTYKMHFFSRPSRPEKSIIFMAFYAGNTQKDSLQKVHRKSPQRLRKT